MVSKGEIKKLTDLARIRIEDKEIESLRGEMDAILDYVGQVKEIAGSHSAKASRDDIVNVNVMREDENPTESDTYSKELIAEFPDKEGNYLKVKKIL